MPTSLLGDMHCINVFDMYVAGIAFNAPNRQYKPLVFLKPVPVMDIKVEPDTDPDHGAIL